MDIERETQRESGQSTYSKHTDIITSSLKAMTFNLTNLKLPFLPFHRKKYSVHLQHVKFEHIYPEQKLFPDKFILNKSQRYIDFIKVHALI